MQIICCNSLVYMQLVTKHVKRQAIYSLSSFSFKMRKNYIVTLH